MWASDSHRHSAPARCCGSYRTNVHFDCKRFFPTKLKLGSLTTNDILTCYGIPRTYIVELNVRFACNIKCKSWNKFRGCIWVLCANVPPPFRLKVFYPLVAPPALTNIHSSLTALFPTEPQNPPQHSPAGSPNKIWELSQEPKSIWCLCSASLQLFALGFILPFSGI